MFHALQFDRTAAAAVVAGMGAAPESVDVVALQGPEGRQPDRHPSPHMEQHDCLTNNVRAPCCLIVRE